MQTPNNPGATRHTTGYSDRAIIRYARWLIRWRWLVIPAILLSVFFIASGARFIQLDGDFRNMFKEDNPQRIAYETLQNSYTKSDNVLFIVAPHDGNVFTHETLGLIQQITSLAWKTPYSVRVDSITNFQHSHARQDDLIVEDLVRDAARLSDSELQGIRAIALNEPQLVNRLVSPQGHVAGINVSLRVPNKRPEEQPEVVAHAREIIKAVTVGHPNVDIYIAGITAFNNALIQSSNTDMQTVVPLMFAVVIVTLITLLRSITGTLATLTVIILSVAVAMGFAGWMGWKLNPATGATPNIVMTLAVANCVHILVTLLQCMRSGHSKQEAIIESLRLNIQPVFLTSVTTALGFMTMNFSESPPFHHMGNMIAMGIMASFFIAVTFMPALIAVLPLRVKPRPAQTHQPLDRFADFVIRRRTPVLWGTSLLTLALVAFVPLNDLNDNFVTYLDKSIPFRQAADFADENLGGTYAIDFSLNAGGEGAVSAPAFLRTTEAFANWLRQQPEVVHVNIVTDTFKRLNKNMHGDAITWYRLPEQRELAAQYLLLYEMSLPYGLDLNNQVNMNKSAIRVAATLKNMNTQQMLALEDRAFAWLHEHAPRIDALSASPSVMFSHMGKTNVTSMLFGTLVALVLISFILIAALRSVKVGLISLAPNLAPAGVAFGIWGIAVGEVGMSLAMVTGMTLGVVVDDTVHFLSKYMRARREKGLGPEAAVRYAFSTVGVALLVTSFVLAAGFLMLALSTFRLNSDMGLMTAMVIVIALVFDFLFLPSLLTRFDRPQTGEKDTPARQLAMETGN